MYHKRKETFYRPLFYNVIYLENGNYSKVFCSDVRQVLYIAVEFLNTTAISDPDVIRRACVVNVSFACVVFVCRLPFSYGELNSELVNHKKDRQLGTNEAILGLNKKCLRSHFHAFTVSLWSYIGIV
jgi:hypothetical protein